MKIPKDTRKQRRKLIIVALAVLLVVGGAIATFAYMRSTKQSVDKSAQSSISENLTEEQKDSGAAIKEETVNDSQVKNTENNANKASGVSTDASKSVVVTITSPSEQSGESFSVRAFINRSTTEGSCSASLTRQNQSSGQVTGTGMQPQSNISACKTLSIDTSSLEKGAWKLSVTFRNDAGLSGSVTEDITLK